MPIRDARQRIAELAAAGGLRGVRVEGWREEGCLHPKPLAGADQRLGAVVAVRHADE